MTQSGRVSPFKRVVMANNSQHSPRIEICYQPEGYWSDQSVRLILEYKTKGEAVPLQSLTVSSGAVFNYSIKYAAGGQNSGLNDLDLTANFIATLTDARELALQAISMAESNVPFLGLAEFFMLMDMRRASLQGPNSETAVVLVLGGGTAVLDGCFWHTAEDAIASVQGRKVEVLQADEQECNYWWYIYYARNLSMFGSAKQAS